jgi:aerobic carbon-monoxide dehydrogenase medium subunit
VRPPGVPPIPRCNMATIGGNICAANFAASDFAPALLSLDASVDVATTAGERRVSFSEFLAARSEPDLFVTRVTIRRRLPLRKAGDYPVAIVSVSTNIDAGSRVREPRIAVGAVEQVAKRWTSLEQTMVGASLQTQALTKLAGELSRDFTGREGVAAPGWYRVKVLPGLVRKAFGDLAAAFAR